MAGWIANVCLGLDMAEHPFAFKNANSGRRWATVFLLYLLDACTKNSQENRKFQREISSDLPPKQSLLSKKFDYTCQLWLINCVQDCWVKLRDWLVMSVTWERMDMEPHVFYVLVSRLSSICHFILLLECDEVAKPLEASHRWAWVNPYLLDN